MEDSRPVQNFFLFVHARKSSKCQWQPWGCCLALFGFFLLFVSMAWENFPYFLSSLFMHWLLFYFSLWGGAVHMCIHTHMHMWNPLYLVFNKSIILLKIKVYLVFANIGAYLQYFVSVCPSKWFYFIVNVLLNVFASFCTYQSIPPLYNYIYISPHVYLVVHSACLNVELLDQHSLTRDTNFLIHFLHPLFSLLVTSPWIHSTLVLRHQLS